MRQREEERVRISFLPLALHELPCPEPAKSFPIFRLDEHEAVLQPVALPPEVLHVEPIPRGLVPQRQLEALLLKLEHGLPLLVRSGRPAWVGEDERDGDHRLAHPNLVAQPTAPDLASDVMMISRQRCIGRLLGGQHEGQALLLVCTRERATTV